MDHRTYHPELGRFIQTDPIDFDTGDLNIYRYVGNNPVNWVDPLGLWQVTIGGGAGIGGLITFGYNNGQFNFGGFVGAAEGSFASIDFTDSECQERGLSTGGKAVAEIGGTILGGRRSLGISGDSGGRYMSGSGRSDPYLGINYGSGRLGWGPRPGGGVLGGGIGAFVGVGAIRYH